jgi:hypothetical protein
MFSTPGGLSFELKNRKQSPSFYGEIIGTNQKEGKINLKLTWAGDKSDSIPGITTDTKTTIYITAGNKHASVSFDGGDVEPVRLEFFPTHNPVPGYKLLKKNAHICLHMRNPDMKICGKVTSSIRTGNDNIAYRFVPYTSIDIINDQLPSKARKTQYIIMNNVRGIFSNAILQTFAKGIPKKIRSDTVSMVSSITKITLDKSK